MTVGSSDGERVRRLVERDTELAAVAQRLEDARSGTGAVVYVEAAAGCGKSEIVAATADMGRQAGMHVRQATGRELERDFPFAVAIQLLDEPSSREVAIATGEGAFRIIHDLFSTVRAMAQQSDTAGRQRGIVLIVDDAHRADAMSLRFLAYLSARLTTLPVVVVVAVRKGARCTDSAALKALRRAAGDVPLAPRNLTEGGVRGLVRAELPAAGRAFARACAQITGGNPALVSHVLRATAGLDLKVNGSPAELLGALMPEPVLEMVESQLMMVSPAGRGVACALAVLGGRAPIRRVATVAELELAEASGAVDELVEIELLAPGAPLAFALPLVANAVRASVSPASRSKLHARAAGLLTIEHAPAAQIAAHLLQALPVYDPEAIEQVRAAALRALSTGAAEAAIDILTRALDQEADTGRPAPLARHPRPGQPGDEGELNRPASEQATALAHMTVQSSLRGARRSEVRHLADLAWADGGLLDDPQADHTTATLLAGALMMADDLERSLEITDHPRLTDPEAMRPTTRVAIGYCRAWALYHQGRVGAAVTEAEAALEVLNTGLPLDGHNLRGVIAASRIQLGELTAAEDVLSMLVGQEVDEIDRPALLEVRAQLRLAQMRPAEALRDALEAGRLAERASGEPHPGIISWRSTAALAQIAHGDLSAARRLAQEELDIARSAENARAVLRALRVLGLATTGKRGRDLLAEAVALGSDQPVRLEYIAALVDLGAAMRRANRRLDARAPLEEAVSQCRVLGANALEARATAELTAAGGRSRRTATLGVDPLTPSERRVADLAAQGHTTREIASELFVTPKTIEFHLRHIYGKLDIASSREELAKAIANKPE